MSTSDLLMHQPVAQAVGWALLQFVWQGTVLGLLTALILRLLRRSEPDIRYVVSAIGLALMLTVAVVTALQAVPAAAPGPAARAAAERGQAAVSPASRSPQVTDSAAGPIRTLGGPADRLAIVRGPAILAAGSWLPWLVVAWMCGVSLLSLRLASGWLLVQRMKRDRAVPAADRWQQTARRLSRQLHIARSIRLLESAAVVVPTVIGWLRPVVLLPTSALAGLSPEQVEAILAHELAHIRRHDYLVNLLQTLVETLLFYHPAVWWLSRRIRAERENCCDDLAVSLCGDPYAYAKALADLEELRGASGRLVLAASGGSLLQRVRRLVSRPSHAGRGPGWAAGAAAVMLITGVAAGAIGNEMLRSDGQLLVGSNRRSWQIDRPRLDLRSGDIAAVAELLTGAREATHALADGAREATRAFAAGARDAKRALHTSAQRSRPTRLFVDTDDRQRFRRAPEAPLPPAAPEAPRALIAPTAGDLAEPAALAELPAVPQPPSAPAPPAPPSAPRTVDSHSSFSWSNGREKLEVRIDGAIEFSDDDRDVRWLSPGGSLTINDNGWLSGRTLELKADRSGTIERRFRVGRTEMPFEPDGRRWLADTLPRLIRQTGIGASSRVARLLRSGGPGAVLTEIALIEGSWAKRLYFSELLKASTLDAATRARVLAQASREIDSDFELASLLIDSGDRLTGDDGTRRAYLDATKTIGSDFEQRRVLSSAVSRVATTPGLLAILLDASAAIGSDFEQATLLIEVAKGHALDGAARGAFFRALAGVESDFEQRRVLSALAERADLPDDVVRDMLDSSSLIESDFEQATLLTQIAERRGLAGAIREPFFRASANVASAFERGRVLQAVVKRPALPEEVLVGVLRAVADMRSNAMASQVLQTVASRQKLTGQARDLYIDIAGRLGQFEQGQALTALVKNERR